VRSRRRLVRSATGRDPDARGEGRAVSTRLILALSVLTMFSAPAAAQGFDHAKHRKVFASCTACHRGITELGASMFPDPASCASCHDGTIEKRVTWTPRVGP